MPRVISSSASLVLLSHLTLTIRRYTRTHGTTQKDASWPSLRTWVSTCSSWRYVTHYCEYCDYTHYIVLFYNSWYFSCYFIQLHFVLSYCVLSFHRIRLSRRSSSSSTRRNRPDRPSPLSSGPRWTSRSTMPMAIWSPMHPHRRWPLKHDSWRHCSWNLQTSANVLSAVKSTSYERRHQSANERTHCFCMYVAFVYVPASIMYVICNKIKFKLYLQVNLEDYPMKVFLLVNSWITRLICI